MQDKSSHHRAGSNFLVIRFSSLGDVILAAPVFENIRTNYPGSFIYFLTKKRYRDVFQEDPFVDRVAALEDFSFPLLLKFIHSIKPSAIFDLHNSLRSNLLDFLSFTKAYKAKKYRRERKKILSGKKIEIPPVRERYVEPLARAGLKIHTTIPKIYLSKTEIENGKKILLNLGIPENSQVISVAPLSKWKNKEWSHFPEFFEIAAKPGRFFLILGDDFKRAEKFLPEKSYIRSFIKNVSGTLSLRDVFSLLYHSDLLISMDSGIYHAGEAIGVPTIVFFGPTVPAFGFAPVKARILEVDIPCRPCHLHGGNFCKRGDHACLDSISPDEVLDAVEEMLNR